MSSKIDLSEVIAIINAQKLSPPDTQALIKEIKARAQTKEADKEPGEPKAKAQHVVVGNADGSFGWVIQMAESDAPHSVIDRVNNAAHAFNASKAGRLLPVTTVGEAFESVKRRFMKDAGLTVKTKLMVPIIMSTNKLSEAPSV